MKQTNTCNSLQNLQGFLVSNHHDSVNWENLLLYTDGSCLNKTKQGGWGWILKKQYGNHLETLHKNSSGCSDTTISRMEMTAILDGLLYVVTQNFNLPLYVISDSQFIVNSFNKGWFKTWKDMNFVGRPNKDLWLMFDEVLPLLPNLHFVHTRGHEKGMEFHKQGNTEVDALCSYKNFFK